MNLQDPNAGQIPPSSEEPYYDRSTGLMIFGILTILLGGLIVLFIFLMLLGAAMSAASPMANSQVSLKALLPALSIYVVLAVALVWLGIGSIQAKRWARALMVIFSWSWLVTGIFAMAMLAYVLPKIMENMPNMAPAGQPAPPQAALYIGMLVGFAIDGFIFLVMPAIWTYFYNSRHVKLTCEWRDPVVRWTDLRPLPVLAVCLWLAFSTPMFVIMPFAYNGVAPFFGIFLTGIPGTLYYFVMAGIWGYAGWLLFQLDRRGWWMLLIALCIFMISGVITYAQHDMLEMYQLMGYPQTEIDQIRKSGLAAGNNMVWLTLIFMVPFMGYLFYIKRFLRRN